MSIGESILQDKILKINVKIELCLQASLRQASDLVNRGQ